MRFAPKGPTCTGFASWLSQRWPKIVAEFGRHLCYVQSCPLCACSLIIRFDVVISRTASSVVRAHPRDSTCATAARLAACTRLRPIVRKTTNPTCAPGHTLNLSPSSPSGKYALSVCRKLVRYVATGGPVAAVTGSPVAPTAADRRLLRPEPNAPVSIPRQVIKTQGGNFVTYSIPEGNAPTPYKGGELSSGSGKPNRLSTRFTSGLPVR
jgi:hypothetical protein